MSGTEPRTNERGEPLMTVWLAYPWTDPDGTEHAPDSSVEVDTGTAASLIGAGLARGAEEQPEAVGGVVQADARRKTTAAKATAAKTSTEGSSSRG